MSAAQSLAAWASALEWQGVPEEQRTLVSLRVLDTVGLVLAGRDTPAVRATAALAGNSGGRTPAAFAALVQGTAAHCRDFDDTFLDSVVHPGSTVLAAALAVGEAIGAQDEEVATAIVVGYEAAARIGGAAARGLHARGFHPTGVVGPLSASLVAARLYRLPAAAAADALGLAASMAGGLMSFADDGAWSKWLHAGWAAHGGVIAAQLAAQGFRGPRGVLDGRHNLFGAFTGAAAPSADALCGGLGSRWQGGAAHFKYYPCAHAIQPYIDAAIALRRRHALSTDLIERVSCAIAPWAVPIVCEPRAPKLRPACDMDAIASLPYQVSVALCDGGVNLAALDPACRTRADVLELATRIEHREDAALGEGFDGEIEIRLRSGERLRQAVASAPPDRAKLVQKFRANARRALPPAAVSALEHAILDGALPRFRDVARLS